MTAPSNVVSVPTPKKPPTGMPRLLNESLRQQLAYFNGIEDVLPADLRTGTDISVIATESEASSFIGRLTRTLYSEGVRAKERRHQELIERKYLIGLTADDEGVLSELTKELSDIDEGFYRPIIDRLKSKTDNTQVN